jgi:hypothetical protein
VKQKRVDREQTSRENKIEREREKERERKRDRALLQKGYDVGNKQVIYEGQRKDNTGPYQDGNKASPKNL